MTHYYFARAIFAFETFYIYTYFIIHFIFIFLYFISSIYFIYCKCVSAFYIHYINYKPRYSQVVTALLYYLFCRSRYVTYGYVSTIWKWSYIYMDSLIMHCVRQMVIFFLTVTKQFLATQKNVDKLQAFPRVLLKFLT